MSVFGDLGYVQPSNQTYSDSPNGGYSFAINGGDGGSPIYVTNGSSGGGTVPGPTPYVPPVSTPTPTAPPNVVSTNPLPIAPTPQVPLEQYTQNSGVTPSNTWATNTYGTGLNSVPGGVGGAVGGPTPVGGVGGSGSGTWGSTASPGGWLPPGPQDMGGANGWKLPANASALGITGGGNPLLPNGNQLMQPGPSGYTPSTGIPNGIGGGFQPGPTGYSPTMGDPNTSGFGGMQPGPTGYTPTSSNPNVLMQNGGQGPGGSTGIQSEYNYNPVNHDPFAAPM